MSEACEELVALSLTMKEFTNLSLYPMKIFCDNNAAILSSQVEGGNALRHVIEIRVHYVKECVEKGLIDVEWTASDNQLAEIFTKPLSFLRYERQIHRILSNEQTELVGSISGVHFDVSDVSEEEYLRSCKRLYKSQRYRQAKEERQRAAAAALDYLPQQPTDYYGYEGQN